MKTRTILFMVAAILMAFQSVASNTEQIIINQVDNLNLGKSAEKVWTISYSDQEKPVTIALRKVLGTNEYVVRTEFFEVIYLASNEGFGVRRMHPGLRQIPRQISGSVLNKKQLKQQTILTPDKISDEYALKLIASYLPDLLNEGYKHLIY